MMRQFVMVNDPANCDLDSVCEAGEDGFGCADCAQLSGAACGNGLCEIGDGEDCTTCPSDCNGEQQGGNQFCCGNGGTNPIACGTDDSDPRCIDTSADLFCRVAVRVEATCGDLLCEGQESADNCPQDCSLPFCEPTETIDELSCADGQDNDCDGFVDATDTDCTLPDTDGDGVPDATDNCPDDFNPSQEDFDGDGAGYVCDITCATTIDFAHTFSNGDTFELLASDSITFEGTMESGSIITFNAPSVILQNSTSIQVGVTFRSKTMGCIP